MERKISGFIMVVSPVSEEDEGDKFQAVRKSVESSPFGKCPVIKRKHIKYQYFVEKKMGSKQ